ncbi:MAG TPA: nuclear transport factor 2 family protein [Burkholderiales bacterium]
MPTTSNDLRLDALVAWYETLAPATLADIGRHYAANAWFRDPFNEVTGREAIRHIFVHMFEATGTPRFEVTSRAAQGNEAFLAWTFRCTLRGRAFEVRGMTHLEFNARGKVARHHDHWDAAGELYEKFPVLGGLMRWLRRRLSAGG